MADRVIGWTPDGKRVLFASSRESGRQRFNQFYTVGLEGGLPEKLPVPYGEFGTYSPDGTQFVYMPMSQDFRNWKRYRGGWAPDLMLFDLKTFATKNITSNPANDAQPMWHGNTIYFLSDRGANERNNIWAYDVAGGAVRQITAVQRLRHHVSVSRTRRDRVPGWWTALYARPCHRQVDGGAGARRQRRDDAAAAHRESSGAHRECDRIADAASARCLKRAATCSPCRPNMARSSMSRDRSGVAERYPRWSPDGKTVAYWSDRTGEYELTLRPADGSGPEKKATSIGPGFRYAPQWSPDNKKLAFIDQAMRIRIHDLDANTTTEIDQSPEWISHGGLETFRVQWSPDSRWLTYARPTAPANTAVFLYDTKTKKLTQATSGYLTDAQPTFDSEGKYLFYASDREFEPVYGSFDNSWTYPNPTRIVAVPLRKNVKSPLAARNDSENPLLDTNDKDDSKKDDSKKDAPKKPDDEDKRPEPAKPADRPEARSRLRRRPTTRRQTPERRTRKKTMARSRRNALLHRPTSTSISTASRPGPSYCHRRRGTTRTFSRSKASCSIAALPRTGRATTRTRLSSSI